MGERGDSVAALWRNAHVGRAPLIKPGDIRLLCEPASNEGTASSRAAGLKTTLLRTQVVLAGKWPNVPGIFATRVWRPRRQPQPALLAACSPMSKGGLVEMLLCSPEDGAIDAMNLSTAAQAAKTLKHSESSSTVNLALEGAKTEEAAAVHTKEKQDHIIVIEILKFVRCWQDDLHKDSIKLREFVEATADQAKKECKDFLIQSEDRSATDSTMMPMIHEQVNSPQSARGRGAKGHLQLGSLMVPLRRPSKGHMPLPGLPQLNASGSKGSLSLSSRKGAGKGAVAKEEEKWSKKAVRTEHVVCLELPKPLDRLYLLLSKKDRPHGNKLEAIRHSSDPPDAFADLLLGESRHSLHELYSSDTATLVKTRPIVSRNFAAMTALFGNECQVAKLGPLGRPKDDLKMLCLWSNLLSLTYSDQDVTDLSVLSRLEVLEVLELHDMGPGLVCLADCKPPCLQHLTIRKCPGLTCGQNLPQVQSLKVLVVEHCDAMKTLTGIRCVPSFQMAVTHCPKFESVEGLSAAGVELPPMIDFGWNPILQHGIYEVACLPSVQFLDLQGCPKLDSKALLHSARAVKTRSGHAGLVCPSLFPIFTVSSGDPMSPRMSSPRTLGQRAWGSASPKSAHSGAEGSSPRKRRGGGNPWGANESESSEKHPSRMASQQATELGELFDLASEAAEAKVQSAKMLSVKILADHDDPDRIGKALTILGEPLRHMKEINGTPVTADEMKVHMLMLQHDAEDEHSAGSRRGSPQDGMLESLRSHIEFVPIDIGCQLLSDMGFNRDAAKELLQYVDADHKGQFTESDLALLFEHGSPASTEEVMIFYVWIHENFQDIAECYDALVEESPWGSDDLLSRAHFEHAVMEYGYGKSNSKAVFTCFDADRRAGFITANEFELIEFFVAFHALKIAEGFKKQLCKKYKDLERAYKALCNEDGKLMMSDLQELGKKAKVFSRQAVCDAAWHFLRMYAPEEKHMRKASSDHHKEDGGSSEEVSRASLMALEHIDATAFRHDLRKLSNHIMMKYGSFDAAFAALNPRKSGLTHDEFIAGYKHLHFDSVCDLDPALFYHFLDLQQTGMVSKKIFAQLGVICVEAMWEDLAENRDKLLRRFRGNATECFGRLQAILKEKKLKEGGEDRRQSGLSVPTSPRDDPSSPKKMEAGRPPKVQSMRALKSSVMDGFSGASPKTPGTTRQARAPSGLSSHSEIKEF
eukprot:gnl/MRDRNA2_/MRDRNA2_42096_c0_seq1.p1 gnl/MRDRNA2_/MRDRNA2_42096_c0~~gnl/MRDRNA2_/MRDRNA2_42096_c0_seq1.p1  ORF type:complete len:1205 (+),score=228.49 gnl/MRDRNA2_/MRDRNA2_42096_c0_seq1:97-3711(+)